MERRNEQLVVLICEGYNCCWLCLEKRGGFHFGVKDVFLNIAGGLKVEDPSIDLAVLCALLSSYEDVPIQPHICFAGEVGLSGEIRAVNRIEQRIAEAEKLALKKSSFPSTIKRDWRNKNLTGPTGSGGQSLGDGTQAGIK